MRCAVVVPVKSFTDAKARLSAALTAAQREELARSTAEAVLEVVRDRSPHVVCDDAVVATWARAHGAIVVDDASHDLDGAVATGLAHVRAAGFDHAAVVHADLIRPEPLRRLIDRARPGAVTLVPDVRRDGTNVAIVPTTVGWVPAYGPGSFLRHLRSAQRMRLAVEVVLDGDLAHDVDLPEDLRHPSAAALLHRIADRATPGGTHSAAPSSTTGQATRSTAR